MMVKETRMRCYFNVPNEYGIVKLDTQLCKTIRMQCTTDTHVTMILMCLCSHLSCVNSCLDSKHTHMADVL